MKKVTAIVVVAAAFALSACETNPRVRAAPKPVYDIKINQPGKDNFYIEDVGISLKPITPANSNSYPSLFSSYRYWNPKNSAEGGVAKDIMVSLPAFEVQVSNSSNQTISFQKTSIRLIDDSGNTYQSLLKQDVIDFTEQQLTDVQSRGWAVDYPAAMGFAKKIKLLDKNYESLPGITEKRILAFDLNNATNSKEFQSFMANTKYLRVVFFNVPVRYDEAGNVTKVSKFEYVFDVTKR